MEVNHIYKNQQLGYSIFFKKVSNSDLSIILKIIRFLGFKRDFVYEARLRDLAPRIKMTKEEKLNWQEQAYKKSKNHDSYHFSYLYSNKMKAVSIQWKHKQLSGEEFVSLCFSN